ncbi:regulator of nonsense transcripts 2 isoform X1 [Schistocerca piceifrons]|uniref:regulator of nonsense transcripts 2 isoform X1 n=1 Tax=Schistocerca piceifrons TaxID=274613 RepID=UPI001F5E53AC|nr:regulator of nonsense transcripts 2 isoform X1 [Schistocerca piceifrons]
MDDDSVEVAARQQIRPQNDSKWTEENSESLSAPAVSSDVGKAFTSSSEMCDNESVMLNVDFFGEKATGDDQDVQTAKEMVSQSIGLISQKKPNIDSFEPADVDQSFVMEYINQTNYRIFVTSQLRNYNYYIDNCRPAEEHFVKLDSSVKRNAAFVKKLRTFTGSQIESLLKDVATLNLTKYLSEVAAALVDTKLKMSDVWAAVKLCNMLHLTYPEFKVSLLENWQRALCIRKDDKISNPAKLRVDIRFYAELISVGIFTLKEGLPLLGNVLTMLINTDKEQHNNVNIILSFCHHCGDDYAGLVPRKLRMLLEKFSLPLPQYDLLPKEKQQNVKALLLEYYNSLCKRRSTDYCELQAYIKRNEKILQTKGQLSFERKERLEELHLAFQNLDANTLKFSEVLDVDVPPLPVVKSAKHESLNSNSESEECTNVADIWDDDDSRQFYEVLPDLKEFMPNLQTQVIEQDSITEEALDMELDTDTPFDDDQPVPDTEETDDSEIVPVANKPQIETFVSSLTSCVNRELIDSASVEFVMNLNTKSNRKKLIKSLINVPRTRLDLIPMYARLVATLYPVAPEIGVELSQLLKQAFRYHVRKKDQMKIETKIKIVTFIGELIKFQVYSKIEGLYCLKMLIHDFTHHHIQMCCCFLESCGRYLFKHPDSSNRMKIFLEQIMRKKSVMALDSRHILMIENAYYSVNPPDVVCFTRRERPPEQEFIRKILYQDLTKYNSENVLCLMRKLDWDQSDMAAYAIKCLICGFKVKYENIAYLASIVSGLALFQDFVGPMVVDGVLEDIRLGMELNLPKYNQRRVAMIKYLGELYNYRMIDSKTVFRVLYSLITFGVSWDLRVPSAIDPPESLSRIRLSCVLLDTCGNYFVTGRSKATLETYLVFFQHYYLLKYTNPFWNENNLFPPGIKLMFQETVLKLFPNAQLHTSLAESDAEVKRICDEYKDDSDFLFTITGTNFEHDADDVCSDSDEYPNHICEVTLESESVPLENMLTTAKDHSGNTMTSHSETVSLSSVSVVKSVGCFGEKDLTYASDALSYTGSDILDDWETDGSSMAADGGGLSIPSGTFTSEPDVNEDDCKVSLKPSLIDCPEDNDFQIAFEQMVSENIQDRIRGTPMPQRLDIVVPLHIRSKTKKTYEQLKSEDSDTPVVNFVLMLKKGNKQQYKNVNVPIDSDMAMNLKNQEEAERAEKERVKRLTLNMSARLEEEEYQEMLARSRKTESLNTNYEKRPKYNHPKGAPDTDFIFGTKKMK